MSRSDYIPRYGFKDRLTFGKYAGKSIREIMDLNPDYLNWAMENIPNFNLVKRAEIELEGKLEAIEDALYNEYGFLSDYIDLY